MNELTLVIIIVMIFIIIIYLITHTNDTISTFANMGGYDRLFSGIKDGNEYLEHIKNYGIKYYNITHDLYDKTDILLDKLDIDVKDYYKFNPGIVILDTTPKRYLITFRIFIGNANNGRYDIFSDSHYWKNFWKSENYHKLWKKDLTTNLLGIALLDENFKVINSRILYNLLAGEIGVEDVRLFKLHNSVYFLGHITHGEGDPQTWGDIRYMRVCICKLASQDDILMNFNKFVPERVIQLNNNMHEIQIEKNWCGFVLNDELYITRMSYPNFFPIKIYKCILDKVYLNTNRDGLSRSILRSPIRRRFYNHVYSHVNGKLICEIKQPDMLNNFPDRLNKLYHIYTGMNMFRFSGGTMGLQIGHNTFIFMGHLIVKVNENCVNALKQNMPLEMKINMKHFLRYHDVQLRTKLGLMRYYMFFYILDVGTCKITHISNAMCIFENANEITQVNFPVGLERNGQDIIISLGESDAKVVIVTMNYLDVMSRMKRIPDINYEKYSFDTYIP